MTTAQQGKNIVIHVVQHLAPGGLESLVLDLVKFSNTENHVVIVSLEGDKKTALKQWPRLEEVEHQLLFLDKPSGVSFQLIHTLTKLFKLLKPHVVHTHHIGPLMYAAPAARFAGVPHRIHTEHDVWHLNNKKHVLIQKAALAISKPTLVGDATRVSDTLVEYFDYHNTHTIKNGVDCDKFTPGSRNEARAQLGLVGNTRLIGCAGRLEYVKGHDIAIRALVHLPADICLAIAGEGSQRGSLEDLVKQLGLQNRVVFLGLVSDMPLFYRALNVFCMPSRMEGFPLSTLEAQACDTPTVATGVGATSETLCPLSSKLVAPSNPLQFAQAIEHLINNTETQSPRTFVKQHNDIRKMVKAYEALSADIASTQGAV